MESTRGPWDAIVVGSGVGGAVAGSLLAHAGRRVLIVEKNPAVGGILASHDREGFRIDAGSHLIARGAKGPLGDVLRRLSLDHPCFLTHSLPVRARGIFRCSLPGSRARLPFASLRALQGLGLSPGQALGMARLVWRILSMGPEELLLWDRRTLDELILTDIDNPAAYYLVSFLASIFFVLPPAQVSAGESILALRSVIRDWSLSYIEGGMSRYVEALLEPIRAAGGLVLTGARVAAIVPAGENWRVSLADGREWTAPSVLCNLPAQELLHLCAEGLFPADWVKRVHALVPSGNAWQVRIALKRPLIEEGCLIGGISASGMTVADLTLEGVSKTVAAVQEGRITDPLAVYAPVPTNFDPSLAPAGRQLVVASLYGPTRPDPVDPPERWKEAAIRALASVVPHLEEEILFTEFLPITEIGRWMGRSSNAAISNGQCPGQVGADRLPVATPLPGLFLVGDGAGGRGIGTELAASSGIEAAEAVMAAPTRAGTSEAA